MSISKDIGEIKTTLAAQHETLKEHIRRTEVMEKQMEPIKKHVAMVEGALKLIALGGMVAAIVDSIHQLLK